MVRIMPSIDNEDRHSRVFDRRLFKSLGYNLSYQKLPQQLVKISILKLDGSSFDVCVGKNAKVGELKEAVEDVFRSSPEDGETDISWSHVWGHFCLCHKEQKLLNDKVHVRNLGINDGDQLKFIQHLSINYSPPKQRPKKTNASSTHLSMPSLPKNDDENEKHTSINDSTNFVEDHFSWNPSQCQDEEDIQAPKFKLTRTLNNRRSYNQLKTSTRRSFLWRDRWLTF